MSKANKCGKARRWVFTINNYSDAELTAIKGLTTDTVKYLICGREVGEQKTPHLQGAVVWNSAKSLTAIKGIEGFERAHLEVMRGDIGDSEEYCSKEGEYFEVGEPPVSKAEASKRGGEKTAERYAELWDLAKKGDVEEIEPDLRVKHYNTIRAIRKDYGKRPEDLELPKGAIVGLWIWGKPGCGKSRWVRHYHERDQLYDKQLNKWWDGYVSERVVLLDDFDRNHACLGSHLKRWADRYSFPAEWKGGKTDIRPQKIIVTSNLPPERIWEDDKDAEIQAAILRRFIVIEFVSGGYYSMDANGDPMRVNYDPFDEDMSSDKEEGAVATPDYLMD